MLEPAKNGTSRPATAAQATVLLVDDSREVRELFACLLRRAGYRVLEARDAGQAQQLAGEQAKIDILVTDFRMPGMNGVELARWFHTRFPFSQVLLVSGSTCELDAYLEPPGWPAFLDKSAAFTRLVPMVAELLAQATTRSEEFGAAEIAQRASAETLVLRKILERADLSRSWVHVINE
jgi:DNA-binding NtrC family response regulator